MNKKVIIGIAVIVVLIVGGVIFLKNTGASGQEVNKVATNIPTEAPTAAPTEPPTEAPTPQPTEAPTAEPTPEPTEVPFSWEDIATQNDILYATLAGAKYMAEPREDADLVTEPAVDTELYIEAVAYVDGVPSIYIKTTHDGTPVYVDTTYIAEVVKEVAEEAPADEKPAYLTKSLEEMTLNDFKNKELAGYTLTDEECRRVNELIGAPQTPITGTGVYEEPSQEDLDYLNDKAKELGITFQ